MKSMSPSTLEEDHEMVFVDSDLEQDQPESKYELNPDFQFEMDSQLLVKDWSIHNLLNLKNSNPSTIDEKISKFQNQSIESDDQGDDDESDAINDQDPSHQEDDEHLDSSENEFSNDEDDEEDQEDEDEEDQEEEEEQDILHDKKKAEFFEIQPEIQENEVDESSFTSLKLSRPILKGIASLGFTKPTLIQSRTIPIALLGKDICASAMTGSGKTGAFIIPILERLLFRPKQMASTRVLILVPTRELGAQCFEVGSKLAQFTDIQFCLCVGGLSSKQQEVELKKRPDIVIATPGRLIDHIHNSPSFNLDSIEILIMDEADRMLEDGFHAELTEIIKNTPKSRQTMLFSATMTDNVDDLIKLSLNRPVRLFVNSSTSIASRLTQEFVRVRSHREASRPALLLSLCKRTFTSEVIVFFKSKASAHQMKIVFGLLGLKAAELHGNLTQLQRLEALESFRDKKVDFLLATDLASRGLDIHGIKTVINYDMPKSYSQYVHRVGRTARASRAGRSVSFVGEMDRPVLKLAIKNAQESVKHRVIPSLVVQKWETKISSLDETIKTILKEEKEEKHLRIAEMEVQKAENMMIHEEEIKSRPAKVWFQTEKEKAASKALGSHKNTEPKPKEKKRGKLDGLSRRKKRLFEARKEDAVHMNSQKASARSKKASQKPKKLLQEPTSATNGSLGQAKTKTKSKKRVFDQELSFGKSKKAK